MCESLGNSQHLHQKKKNDFKKLPQGQGMLLSSVVEPTLNLCEALGSNPQQQKQRNNNHKTLNCSMNNPKTRTVAPS